MIKYVHFLNIDIVAGVAATGILAERVTGSILPWSWWIVVPLSAWVVYTADRLIDVQLAPTEHPSYRHQFHARHRRVLIAACIIVLVVVAVIAITTFTMWMLLAAPVCVAVIVAHHVLQRLTGQRYMGTIKDANVIVIYTFATWFIPLMMGSMTWHVAVTLTSFVLIVTSIVLQLSISDVASDAQLGVSSSAQELGPERATLLMRICCTAAGVLATTQLPYDAPMASILILMCACATSLPLAFARMQRPHARLTSELILSLPYLLLAFPGS